MDKARRRRGASLVEFSLVGIPMIFLLISIANMAMGMMTLHTIQEAVEQGARYVVTHGSTCTSGANLCGVTVGAICDVTIAAAPGVYRNNLTVNLITDGGVATLCDANNAAKSWPPITDNTPGKDIIITADFAFTSPIAMFWPGAGDTHFSATTFHAYSRQRLMF